MHVFVQYKFKTDNYYPVLKIYRAIVFSIKIKIIFPVIRIILIYICISKICPLKSLSAFLKIYDQKEKTLLANLKQIDNTKIIQIVLLRVQEDTIYIRKLFPKIEEKETIFINIYDF